MASSTSTLTSTVYDPPPNFALVHPQLYRSSAFTTAHIPFVTSLKLRTCISLGAELPSRVLTSWAEQQGVRLVHLGGQRDLTKEMKDWKPVQEELIKDALEFVLEKANNPCLVMDHSGVYETGIFVGCLRKLERWALSAVLAEYASIAGSKVRAANEVGHAIEIDSCQ
ncbi:hypothetical protein OIO90_004965 [Microbotryomycetes sp. JL221]|nr:hypothetical protein OIO90_004965 [Microbotryomycetes sp. JL221]